jgi:chromosome segregation ATPase
MLGVLSFLAGLGLAGYGAVRWFRERENAVLAEIGDHYGRQHRRMLERIDQGDKTLLAAYAELDHVEAQKAHVEDRLAEARELLDATIAAKAGLEQVLERRTAALATAEVQLDRLRRRLVERGEVTLDMTAASQRQDALAN